MELTTDEIDTIRALIADWGFEYFLKADRAKVIALAVKLGLNQIAEDLS